ncbi:MAG: 4Fe-4S binding protein [Erysipelotrichaceae bacterium]|nr:4Fe-4S binding protein [Erysipelotrichaceae bacterium]
METKDYLEYVVKEVHTTIVATVDEEGSPVTSVIDMMDFDEKGLYFLTAKGKSFYQRLKKRGCLSLTALKGETSLSSVSISVRGKVRELGYEKIPDLLKKNPYMYEIYPTEESREVLTAFQIYEGSGEWFDLSRRPIERAVFTFGGGKAEVNGFFISDACIGCGSCAAVCPQNCILSEKIPYVIDRDHCLNCGACQKACPCGAIEKRSL